MRIFAFILAFTICFPLIGQNPQVAPNGPREDGNIEEQIDYLIKESNNYKNYKVIEKTSLNKLKSNILDSLASVRNRLSQTKSTLTEKNNTIQTLNGKMEALQADLDKTNTEKNSISLFGMNMGKGAFKALMGFIIAALAGLLGLFIFRFKESNVNTVRTKKDLAELQKSFEEHRKRSLEREQKAMRRLQDEINKKSGV